uniref:Putative WRKY62 n=1 Tax=Aquilaria sinensis TaxID=210372 RepID=A0A4D6P2M1_9ROSI|nr:putative WRKY62 [Aquilaria sinensis]
MADKQAEAAKSKLAVPTRPTITLPPRPAMESFLAGGLGLSPGPMTLVSSFFADSYSDPNDQRSFTQLLAGAMASPGARPLFLGNSSPDSSTVEVGSKDGAEKDSGFKQSRPFDLMAARSPWFTVPAGLSPSGLLGSPGFFPLSPQSPFGISHQQALAQVTAQAAFSQPHVFGQSEYQPAAGAPSDLQAHQSLSNHEESRPHMPPSTSNPRNSSIEPSEVSQSDRRNQSVSLVVDKPADDGYNWRKYGQKPIKGCEYPRSYYKCTHLNCPVKKKVERSADGHITEIIYKGQHNHDMPQQTRHAKGGADANGNVNFQAKPEPGLPSAAENVKESTETQPMYPIPGEYQESSQLTVDMPGSSDSEEGGDEEAKDGDDDEPNPKRRNNSGEFAVAPSHKTVSEPKIIVQTRSEVDLLDDGYKWRKYGQKVVKGNPHPRSYYKCTTAGCNVRKHVERASTDPKAVITTYEGKHNHDVPASRHSSHSMANSNNSAPELHKAIAEQHLLLEAGYGNNDQRPVVLRLKEEQIRV